MFSNHFQIGYEMDLVPHLLPCNGQGCLLELGDPCSVLCTLSLWWRKGKKVNSYNKNFSFFYLVTLCTLVCLNFA